MAAYPELTLQRYEEGVTQVNKANRVMKQRLDQLGPERNQLQQRVGELEQQLQAKEAEIEAAKSAVKTEPEGGPTPNLGTIDQAKIDEAVKAAVSSKEAELNAAHAKALEDAKSGSSSTAPAASGSDEAAIKAAVSTRETELNVSFENRLSEAVAKVRTELEKERDELKAKIDALNETIKGLERQVRTAEITRKTLQRTADTNASILNNVRAEVEKKGIKLDTNIPAAPPAAAKPAAPTPSGPAATTAPAAPAAGTAPAQAQPPAGPSGVTRGASVRGRGAARGGAPGRGGGVLAGTCPLVSVS